MLFAGIEYALFFANCPLCYTATPLFTAELSGHRYVVFNRSFGRKIAVFAPLVGFHFALLLLFDVHFGFALR